MLEFPITFGSQYGSQMHGSDIHPVLGRYNAADGYVIVEAEDRHEARTKAFEVLGDNWAFDYSSVEDLDPDGRGWYVLGEIGRIDKDGVLTVPGRIED